MRFARDLHDLLGYSLSAITLKAELARRLVSSNPGRARDETAELLDIARQALADVRLVARGTATSPWPKRQVRSAHCSPRPTSRSRWISWQAGPSTSEWIP